MPLRAKLLIFTAGIRSLLELSSNSTRYVVIVFTLLGAGQVIFSEFVFECPCDEYNAKVVGLLFLCGPPAILLLIGLILQFDCQIFMRRRKYPCERCFNVFLAAVGPAAFSLFLSFLDGDYLACAFSGKTCYDMEDDYKRYVAWTQTISWSAALMVTGVLFLGFIIHWCCQDGNDSVLKTMVEIRKSEYLEDMLNKRIQAQATFEAKNEADAKWKSENFASIHVGEPDNTVEEFLRAIETRMGTGIRIIFEDARVQDRNRREEDVVYPSVVPTETTKERVGGNQNYPKSEDEKTPLLSVNHIK